MVVGILRLMRHTKSKTRTPTGVQLGIPAEEASGTTRFPQDSMALSTAKSFFF